MTTKTVAKEPTLLELGDDELRAERAKAEQGVASVERKLAEVAEEIAKALEAPDAARVTALTVERSRLERERVKATARVAEVGQMIATAAARRAARESMQRRMAEFQQLADETAAGHKVLRGVLEALKKAEHEMPWKSVDGHPLGFRGRLLREELEWDAREAGLAPPVLPEPPPFNEEEAARLLGIARMLASSANPQIGMLSGTALTARGKAAERKKRESSPYAGGNTQERRAGDL
jgi:hypothetical protein